MPPKTTKRKQGANADQGADVGPVTKKRARPTNRQIPAQSKARARMGEYAIDAGRNSSRQFLDNAKRKRRGAHAAKMEIQDKADELIAFIGEQQDKQTPWASADRVVDCISPSLSPALSYARSRSGSTAQENIFEQAMGHLRKMQKSLATQEAACAQANDLERPTWMRWEQDKTDLSALNREAMGIAARVINSMIMPKSRTGLGKPAKDASGIETMAWEMMEGCVPKAGEQTWGTVAHGLSEAFSGVLGLVPRDDGA